ncbi:MAG: hypothetical protein IIU37_11035, partial [Erysipelotrichaceae bacterium]|nr:hypothetical protein [Erysipelotrichaceae bacterium]
MNFNIETSRSQSIDALTCAKNIFREHLHDHSDAIFTDARRDRIIAFSGSKYEAPICYHLVNDPIIYDYLNSFKEDVLINHDNDTFTIVHNGKKEVLDAKIADRVKAIYDTILLSPGIMNKNGEIEIDLKGYHIGSHYGVNLLLGDRSEYADCLQSTPKSVLDELGRGSFRGKQEKQVLATRYVLSPDENGEPANRQFYITENGRQIFYSLDVKNN